MAALQISPLEPYNPSQPFEKWLEDLDEYILASLGENISDVRKRAILGSTIGLETKKVINNFAPDQKDTFAHLVTALKNHYNTQTNDVIERHVFNTMTQNQNENIDGFVTRLRTQASKCNYKVPSVTRTVVVPGVENPVDVNVEFKDLTDDLIRDRIVVGLRDQGTRSKLLREANLTLDRTLTFVRSHEIADEQLQKLSAAGMEISAVKKNKKQNSKKPQIDRENTSRRSSVEKSSSSKRKQCGFCGTTHPPAECPAWGKKCPHCKKKGHFLEMCYTKKNEEEMMRKKSRKVNSVGGQESSEEQSSEESNESSDDEVNELFIGAIKVQEVAEDPARIKQWIEPILINQTKVQCKIDTGAECNVISLEKYNLIPGSKKIQSTSTVLRAYGGKRLPTVGKVTLDCAFKKAKHTAQFFIINKDVNTILGLDSSFKLGFVDPKKAERVHEIKENPMKVPSSTKRVVDKYDDVFDTSKLGEIKGGESTITLKEDYAPVQVPLRKIPFSIKDRVIKEIKRMEDLGVIVKCEEPTEWVSALTIVEEPKKLRLCLDPKQLNKYVMRQHTCLPTPEETIAKIEGSTVFSHLDLKHGYWQLPLTQEASMMTAFLTPIGRYRFLRMPFGLKSANEIFQDRMTKAFEGIEGIIVMFDDILVHAKTTEEHDRILDQCLARCQEMGVKLNPDKCKFNVDAVKYIGNIITKHGVKADPDKVTAIVDMLPPEDKKAAQRFLGMVTYLGKYIPNLSEVTAPIRQLLHKDNAFVWTHEQQEAFNKIKKELLSDRVLAYYDPKADIEIHADASRSGLGACIIQNNRPVAFASRSLTPVEKHYAQIEKELLSIVFAFERFYQYVYGKEALLYTDHKPLIPLLKRSIHESPVRIQRLMLRLQRYSFTAAFKRGKYHVIPDTLSRSATKCDVTESEKELQEECELVVHAVVSHKCTTTMQERIVEETDKDCGLSLLKQFITSGWPDNKLDCPDEVLEYFQLREEFSVFENMVMFRDRIVIPKSLRPELLDRIHEGHQGKVKCKALAKTSVYWRGMGRDIESMVESCVQCLEHQNFSCKQTLISHEVPDRPFQKVAADILEVNGNKYNLIVDYFSKWIECLRMPPNPRSKDIINHCKDVFVRFGFPEVLMSDRDPLYKSAEVSEFCEHHGIEKQFSSSRYAQSNGQVERAVQTVKKLIKKCESDKSDISIALLQYHNTPLSTSVASPAKLVFNRNLKSRLPCINSNLSNENDRLNKIALENRQISTQKYYNKNVKPRKSEIVYKPGENVVFRDSLADRNWKQARIVKNDGNPRSYDIVTGNKRILNRNVKMLLPDKTGRHLPSEREDIQNTHSPEESMRGASVAPEPVSVDTPPQQAPVDLPSPIPPSARPPEPRISKPTQSSGTRTSARLRNKPSISYKV